MLYSLTLLSFAVVCVLVTVHYRHAILPLMPQRIQSLISGRPGNAYAPLSSFESQRAAGLHSSAFDIESNNIFGGDSRVGLDEQGAREVREIMERDRVGFDEARLIRHKQILARNGIDPSGMPLDSKAITRL